MEATQVEEVIKDIELGGSLNMEKLAGMIPENLSGESLTRLQGVIAGYIQSAIKHGQLENLDKIDLLLKRVHIENVGFTEEHANDINILLGQIKHLDLISFILRTTGTEAKRKGIDQRVEAKKFLLGNFPEETVTDEFIQAFLDSAQLIVKLQEHNIETVSGLPYAQMPKLLSNE